MALLCQLPWQQNDQTHALSDRCPQAAVVYGSLVITVALVTPYRFVHKLKN